jgi:hypothetical protein
VQSSSYLALISFDPSTGNGTLIKDLKNLGVMTAVPGATEIDWVNQCLYMCVLDVHLRYAIMKVDFRGKVLSTIPAYACGPVQRDASSSAVYSATQYGDKAYISQLDFDAKKMTNKFSFAPNETPKNVATQMQSNNTLLILTSFKFNDKHPKNLSLINTETWERTVLKLNHTLLAMKWSDSENVLYATARDESKNTLLFQRISLPSMKTETLYSWFFWQKNEIAAGVIHPLISPRPPPGPPPSFLEDTAANDYDPATSTYYATVISQSYRRYIVSINTKTKKTKIATVYSGPYSVVSGMFLNK